MEGSRYFPNDEQPLKQVDAYSELLRSLERINLYNPPVQTCSTGWTFHGFYAGPTSVAYLFYRLSLLYPDLMFKSQSLLDWSRAYLDVGAFTTMPPVDSSHCGIANETLAHLALSAIIEEDSSLVEQLCAYSKAINSKVEAGSDEWLYGRAGFLYFLRLVRVTFLRLHGKDVDQLVASTANVTVSRILESPQPWEWHGRAYLGAAHGAAGIVAQIVLNSPSRASEVQDRVSWILDQQSSMGGFPSSDLVGHDELVQFCHGATGIILSLHSIHPSFRTSPALQSRIGSAISSAQRAVWDRGLLKKTPGLCHGIAGNALVLETQDKVGYFMAHMTEEMLEERRWMKDAGRSDKFAGLFEGEAGRAWAWAALNKGLKKTCIAFNDI